MTRVSEIIEGRYVAGMEWFSIVVRGDKQKAARERARKSGANWFLHRGSEAWAGLATLARGKKPPAGVGFISLGRVAGSRNAYGAAFVALKTPLADGRVWVCGSVDGVPINRSEGLVSVGQVKEHFDRFLRSRGLQPDECRVEGNLEELQPLDVQPLTWDDFIRDIPGGGEFAALRPTRPSLLDSVSPRMRWVLGGSLAAMVAFYGWGEYQRIERERVANANPVVIKDPVLEWGRAIGAWAATRNAPQAAQLTQLLDAVGAAPVELNGWDLTRAECKVQGASWICVAAYDRTRLKSQDPTTGGFLSGKPASWTVTPKTLDLIEAHFSVPLNVGRLDATSLQTIDWHMQNTSDKLQRASRAFSNINLSTFTPTPIVAPRKDDGMAMDKPAAVPQLSQAAVILTGPMRSLDLPEIQGLPVVWSSVVFTISAQSMARASLNQSALMIEAKGDIYAKQ